MSSSISNQRSHQPNLGKSDRSLKLFILCAIALQIIPLPSQDQAIAFGLDALGTIINWIGAYFDRITFPVREAIALNQPLMI